ncbi:hypothetical protein BDZ94DRAFT_1276955, partial [Collybia nuda]
MPRNACRNVRTYRMQGNVICRSKIQKQSPRVITCPRICDTSTSNPTMKLLYDNILSMKTLRLCNSTQIGPTPREISRAITRIRHRLQTICTRNLIEVDGKMAAIVVN